jgi:hypothetical protein
MIDERDDKPSASGFHRVVYCPGSVDAEREAKKTLPEERESDVAGQGTAIHDAISTDDMSELGLTEERIAARLQKMEAAAVEEWLSEIGKTLEKFASIREERFWINHRRLLEPLTSAKVDFALVANDGSECLLLDFKSGFKRVTPSNENWQLKIGLVALDQQFGPFKKARVAVAQHRVGEVFDSCDFSREDIDRAYTEIVFYLQRARTFESPRCAGWWCQYCKAAVLCPEHIAWCLMPAVLSKALQEKNDEPLGLPSKREITDKVKLLKPEALAFIQSRKTVATNLFEAVSSRLKNFTDDELREVGLKRVKTGHTRSVSSISGLWTILSGAGLVSEAEFHSICSVSIGALEELLVNRLRLKNNVTIDEAKAQLGALIADVIITEEKSPSLKPVVKAKKDDAE